MERRVRPRAHRDEAPAKAARSTSVRSRGVWLHAGSLDPARVGGEEAVLDGGCAHSARWANDARANHGSLPKQTSSKLFLEKLKWIVTKVDTQCAGLPRKTSGQLGASQRGTR